MKKQKEYLLETATVYKGGKVGNWQAEGVYPTRQEAEDYATLPLIDETNTRYSQETGEEWLDELYRNEKNVSRIVEVDKEV
jgi:hypothetical protein